MKNLFSVLIISFLIGCNSSAQDKKTTSSYKENFKITKTDAQWKEQLTSAQYDVLRNEGTERPFSSELNKIYKPGTYVCAACETPVFEAAHKFDSGTGWPSFDRAIEGNVAYTSDNKLMYERTEEHCAVCGGHLGHVFNDGPKETTGKRHCINGVALKFIPKNE